MFRGPEYEPTDDTVSTVQPFRSAEELSQFAAFLMQGALLPFLRNYYGDEPQALHHFARLASEISKYEVDLHRGNVVVEAAWRLKYEEQFALRAFAQLVNLRG